MVRKLFFFLFFVPFVTLAQERDVLPADSLGADSLVADTLAEPVLHGTLPERLESLLSDEFLQRTQVGLCVCDLTTDSVLFRHNEQQTMRPGSCEKLVTAITALSQLGVDYNYSTSLLMDGSVSGGVLRGNLYVRAGFDPRFGRDDLLAFVQAVREQGIDTLRGNIILDLSMKDTQKYGWGWCWDDDNPVLTPLLFNGKDTFAAHFSELLSEAGIVVEGSIYNGSISASATTLVTRTHAIDQVLVRMLKESNNLYAESMFCQIGAQSGRAFADRHRAAERIQRLVRLVGLDPNRYQFADGSGLSLYNYASPELLITLLRYAYRHQDIYNHLYAALPIAGQDGTLRKRMRSGTAFGNVRAKTGTVEGISTLCGYARAANGHTLAFAIFNQGVLQGSRARHFQNRVCQEMTK